MGRSIDADSLKDRVSEYTLNEDEQRRFCEIIDAEPTVFDPIRDMQQYRAIRTAVEKQNPKKPEIVRFGIDPEDAVAYCPTCRHSFGEVNPALCQNIRYIVFEVKVNGKKSACPECGQAIDWRDIEFRERNVSKVSHKKA